MGEKKKSILELYPSLKPAYEQVKDVLSQQKETANCLDSKASTFVATATAIFGVGLSLGASRIFDTHLCFWVYFILLSITLVPTFFYYRIWGLATKALHLRLFITLNNPQLIREDFWHLANEDFMYDILLHTEEAFKENDVQLKKKAKYIDGLMTKTVQETFVVIIWIVVVSLVTSYLS